MSFWLGRLENLWNSHPFNAVVKDGIILVVDAQDDKGPPTIALL